MGISIFIDDQLKEILKLGLLEVESVAVEDGCPLPWREIDLFCKKIRQEHQNQAWTEIPGVKETRELYRLCGIDPTKTRPSSEALLRRILQGKGLYKVNNLVDVCNWCSLEFRLPIGLYDADKVKGKVICRLGKEGESFAGIRKDDVHVGGRICMADDEGAFGSPTSDSARTMITENTKRALMVLFALKKFEDSTLMSHLDEAKERIRRFCQGGGFSKGIIVAF
ncbi:MAG: phenylalanine--tRNA ligase beta subunit-related protein [Acidobacteriota bacterium]